MTGAFYYTYAVDLARQSGLGGAWGPIMWGLVGLAGVTGVLSGDAAARYGLGRCLAACLLVLAASVGALGLAESSGPFVAACAAAFGASYFPVAALLLVWSGGVFRERPRPPDSASSSSRWPWAPSSGPPRSGRSRGCSVCGRRSGARPR